MFLFVGVIHQRSLTDTNQYFINILSIFHIIISRTWILQTLLIFIIVCLVHCESLTSVSLFSVDLCADLHPGESKHTCTPAPSEQCPVSDVVGQNQNLFGPNTN